MHEAVWLLFRESNKLVFHLALDPSRAVLPDDKKVRRMPSVHFPSAIFVLIRQVDFVWLIVKLQHGWVMFQIVNERQFVTMALELDGTSHLLAWVSSTHVARRTLDET